MAEYQKKVTLDDVEYRITAMPTKKALKTLAKLTKLLGVSLASMFMNKKDDIAKALPVAVEALSSRMDEDEVVDLVLLLLSCVEADKVQVNEANFDMLFQRKLGIMFKLLVEIVRFQYEDFLSVAVSAGLKEMHQRPTHQTA